MQEMDTSVAAVCDAVLPPGLSRCDGEPPPAPTTFEAGYVLPMHYDKPLMRMQCDAKSENLKFFEVPHVYTWNDVPTTTSVTALAHEYEKPFQPLEAIQSMKTARSQAWPRLEYVVDAQPIEAWRPARGALLHSAGKTVAVVHPRSAGTTDVRPLLHSAILRGATVEDAEAYSYAREMSAAEIMKKWSDKGQLASHQGTEAHYQAELMMNGLPFRWWEPESQILIDFAREHMLPRGIVSHATEKEIVCVDGDVAGSIDAILYDPREDVYDILDYKRSDKVQRDLRGYGKMCAPFSHLDDCKGAAYALQLSLYQYILERDYGMRIRDRILLSLHPDNPFTTSVPYLRDEVDYIMRSRFALVRARRTVAEGDARFRCSLTGAPLHDAVILEESGCVAMEKAAIVAAAPYAPSHELRTEFALRVEELREQVPFEGGQVSWRRLMPETGRCPFQSSAGGSRTASS